MDKLYLVVPCCNEYEVLEQTTEKLCLKLSELFKKGLISTESKIVYVDDGSKDKTWELICLLKEKYNNIIGIKLSRNFGQQNALTAGLMAVKDACDITITLDADLQDDINVLEDMILKYKEGCEIVYGVRKNRDADTAFKKNSAKMYYKLLKLLGADIIEDHADFRLMSAKALDALKDFEEVNLFLRGIVPMIGLKSCCVEYERKERISGKTKYSLKKMLEFGMDGVTSLSVKPMRVILLIGCGIAFVSLVALIYLLVSKLMGEVISDTYFIMASVWLLGGAQLTAIGLIGEYIGKTYMETKKRPRYIIEKIIE